MTVKNNYYSITYLVKQLSQVLPLVVKDAATTPEAVLAQWFKQSKMGQREREQISDGVFWALRHWASLEKFAQTKDGVDWQQMATVASMAGCPTGATVPEETQVVWRDYGVAVAAYEPRVQAECPPWLWNRWCLQGGEPWAQQVAQSFLVPASFDIRVNKRVQSVDQLLKRFAADGIEAQRSPHAPLALRLASKQSLYHHPVYVAGGFEVQDVGSQILCELLPIRKHDFVIDFCAGAGGKTLAILEKLGGTGSVLAIDVDAQRLARLKERAQKTPYRNLLTCVIENENDARLKKWLGKATVVLVDAPCSGLGTLRRNPEVKWRLTEAQVQGFAQRQKNILAAASNLVAPHGHLMYATCSIISDENQEVKVDFERRFPQFKVSMPHKRLQQLGLGQEGATGDLQLLPHRHDCDGFYSVMWQFLGGD